VLSVERIVFELAAGSSIQSFGLSEKTTEKQNAQNHYDRDYDDLD
jgi:hypothetical protein